MVILNQEELFKGQTESHSHGFVKKLTGKVAVSTATSQTLLHMQLMYKIFICQRKQDNGDIQHSSVCYNINEDMIICRKKCLCSLKLRTHCHYIFSSYRYANANLRRI